MNMETTIPNMTERLSRALSEGNFATIGRVISANPSLIRIVLQWSGLRHTAFFKDSFKFYRRRARECGIDRFDPSDKARLRAEFQRSQCFKRALKRRRRMENDPFHKATFTTEISRIRFNRLLRRRRQRRLALG